MAKRFWSVLGALLIAFTMMLGVAGCKKEEKTLSVEDVAYTLVCEMAESKGEAPSAMVVQSGRVTQDGDKYEGFFTATLDGDTIYFTGDYDVKTKEATCKDMTAVIAMSIVGPGPAYTDMESFDIVKVNAKLQK